MLKPAHITDQQFQAAQQPVDETTVNNVFKVMHGYYGNLFLSKFATGVVDDRGRDKGVGSARTVWAHALRAFPDGVVLTALERCQVQHADFPPSLPQFVSLCKACAPRKTYQPEVPAIGMSQELRSRNAAKAREIFERHAARAAGRPVGAATEQGLPGLKALIAGAVAAAGGDEVAELRRLDRMYATEAA